MCYSPKLDGAFCLPCVLFGHRFPNKLGKIKKLFIEPLRYWPDAKAAFKRHEKAVSGLHYDSDALYKDFLYQSSGKMKPIDMVLDSNLKNKILVNRRKLVPVVDTVILSDQLNLPLRGHRDDSKYHPEIVKYSCPGVGNFVRLLNYRV